MSSSIIDSDPADETDVFVRVGLAWGLKFEDAEKLALSSLNADRSYDLTGVSGIEEMIILFIASFDGPEDHTIAIAERMAYVWKHIKTGALPWGTVTHNFNLMIEEDEDLLETETAVVFIGQMTSTKVTMSIHNESGEGLFDEVVISLDDQGTNTQNEDTPDDCDLEDHCWDADLTMTGIKAILEGRQPIIPLRSIASRVIDRTRDN